MSQDNTNKPTNINNTVPLISLHHASYIQTHTPRSVVEYMARNNWRISSAYTDLFSRYYLLYWHPEYLLNEIHNGQIVHESEIYNVIYHDRKNPITYRKHYGQVALSFRKAAPRFGIDNVVLIKGVE